MPGKNRLQFFERCHDNALKGIGFDPGGINVTTDSDGHATSVVDAGTFTVTEDANDTADFKARMSSALRSFPEKS